MRRNCLIGLVLFVVLPEHAEGDPLNSDPVLWSWECRSDGLYGIDVLPDSSYKPFSDAQYSAKMFITFRDRVNTELDKALCRDGPAHGYYVDSEVPGFGLFQPDDICGTARIFLHGGKRPPATGIRPDDIETISEHGEHGQILSLGYDDNLWRFSLTSSHLTTQRESREQKIRHGLKLPAGASVTMMTGECILKDQP